VRIAIDVMGGDHAPGEIARGAVEGARKYPGATLILAGEEKRILEEAPDAASLPNITLRNASQVIGMDEEPVAALRRKRDSSMRVALRMVKNGEADAIISAGNTGALVGGAMLGLGPLEGVKRPGIAIPCPTSNGFAALIDAGANLRCRAMHLLQYGVMGSFYMKFLKKNVHHPTVGLLNIGRESTKGNSVIREAHALFGRSTLNFVGNVEPHEVFQGKVDVVVADGFVGNLMLKMAEGIGSFLHRQISEGIPEDRDDRKVVDKVFEQLDYVEQGGAPLLGARGIVIKAHGRSHAQAITNAVRLTVDFIEGQLNEHIVEEIKKMSFWGRLSDWWTTKKETQDLP
jgi:glycerol-3-phosphate acyltransferase PlsX